MSENEENEGTKTKMYKERKGNVSAYRGCLFKCSYCAFSGTLSRQSCELCQKYIPHAHLEVLNRRPPATKVGEFLTMALTGDVAFASDEELRKMIAYCNKWDDREFVMQSKNPSVFEKFSDYIRPNMCIGTTLESDIDHGLSKAPTPASRHNAMQSLNCRKMVTVEPILIFNLDQFYSMIHSIDPEIVYIGYDSKKNKLPEPTLDETNELINRLREHGFEVREKLISKAWYEEKNNET